MKRSSAKTISSNRSRRSYTPSNCGPLGERSFRRLCLGWRTILAVPSVRHGQAAEQSGSRPLIRCLFSISARGTYRTCRLCAKMGVAVATSDVMA